MKAAFASIAHHLRYWIELYGFVPLAIALTLAGIFGVNWLTGRPVLDSPDAVVGWLYNLIGIMLVVAATGLTQRQLFGYRSNDGPDARLRDDIHDSFVTLCLLALFSYLLFLR